MNGPLVTYVAMNVLSIKILFSECRLWHMIKLKLSAPPSRLAQMRATSWCRQPEAKRRHPNSTAAAVVAAPRSVAHFLFGSISSIIVVISRLLVAPSSKKIAAIIGPREGSCCRRLSSACPAKAWLGQAARPHGCRQETLQEEEQLMSVWNLQVLLFTKVSKRC